MSVFGSLTARAAQPRGPTLTACARMLRTCPACRPPWIALPTACCAPGSRRPLGRRAAGRHDPRIGIHPAHGLPRPRGRRARRARRPATSCEQQLPDGGWSNYPGGPVELSVSVKAYFALKLAGHDPDAPYMQRAREVIRALGGAAGCNSFTKFYLALLGQFPYANCPAVPPEMMLLPRWAYFNIYAMSSWTRTIVVPLSIFSAHQAGARSLPPELGIAELFLRAARDAALAAPADAALADLDQLLPRRRSAAQVARSAGASVRSAGGRAPGRGTGCSSTSPTATASAPSSRR